MTPRAVLFFIIALSLACATTSARPATLPVRPQLVPSSLGPEQALQRVTVLLQAQGFEQPREVLPAAGQEPEGGIAWATGNLAPDDGLGSQRCSGAIEVIQASARVLPGGRTQLGLSCHTERLVDGPSGHRTCDILREPGCAEAGDQMVARLALDSVGL